MGHFTQAGALGNGTPGKHGGTIAYPFSHDTHLGDPGQDVFPRGHFQHRAEPSPLVEPAAHDRHCVTDMAPVRGKKVPAGHGRHDSGEECSSFNAL